jgi:hypothetical protein
MIKIEIETTDNGYIVKTFSLHGDEERGEELKYGLDESRVFQMDRATDQEEHEHDCFKTKNEEKIALGYALAHIAETLGVMYDRYSSDNLSITFDRKGSKVE